MLKTVLMAFAAFAVASPSMATAPCRDAKGKFIKCPPKASVKPMRCKDAKGKFAKCGTPGAKPV